MIGGGSMPIINPDVLGMMPQPDDLHPQFPGLPGQQRRRPNGQNGLDPFGLGGDPSGFGGGFGGFGGNLGGGRGGRGGGGFGGCGGGSSHNTMFG